jgi:hypothetical protein
MQKVRHHTPTCVKQLVGCSQPLCRPTPRWMDEVLSQSWRGVVVCVCACPHRSHACMHAAVHIPILGCSCIVRGSCRWPRCPSDTTSSKSFGGFSSQHLWQELGDCGRYRRSALKHDVAHDLTTYIRDAHLRCAAMVVGAVNANGDAHLVRPMVRAAHAATPHHHLFLTSSLDACDEHA